MSSLKGSPLSYAYRIREYRERTFLTQDELAKKLGVSFVSVNRWENGHFEPSMKMKKKLNGLFKEAGMEVA